MKLRVIPMLDKKSFYIGLLSLSAVILLVANILAPRPVTASETIQTNDYALVTGKALQGGEALYVTDKQTGLMAVFIFDPNRRALVEKQVLPVQNAFAKILNGQGGFRRPEGAAQADGPSWIPDDAMKRSY